MAKYLKCIELGAPTKLFTVGQLYLVVDQTNRLITIIDNLGLGRCMVVDTVDESTNFIIENNSEQRHGVSNPKYALFIRVDS